MTARLRELKAAVEATRPPGASVPPPWLEALERRDDAIVQEGVETNPLVPPPHEGKTPKRGRPKQTPPHEGKTPKRGRPKQTPPRNLLCRLRDFKSQVLAFMYDVAVAFDNNQAERDIRMVQVKRTVSGGFRTLEGAQHFGRLRGYISTARKHAKNVFEALGDALDGQPFMPSPTSSTVRFRQNNGGFS